MITVTHFVARLYGYFDILLEVEPPIEGQEIEGWGVFGVLLDGDSYGVVASSAGGMRCGFFFGLGLSLAVGGAYL